MKRRSKQLQRPSAILPFLDWNGNGRIDPADIGICAAASAHQEVDEGCDGERIALISCSKQKKTYPCAARELYSASTLFSLSYEYAKGHADRIFILSAKHGLVSENVILEPYNETLNEKSASEKRAWSQKVVCQLELECDIQNTHFIILAGKNYYQYLLPYLPDAELPLANLPLGKRIVFLQKTMAGSDTAGRDTVQSSTASIKQRLNRTRFVSHSQETEVDLKIGERIRHSAFGDGVVLDIRGNGAYTIVAVEFDGKGIKRLLWQVAVRYITRQ